MKGSRFCYGFMGPKSLQGFRETGPCLELYGDKSPLFFYLLPFAQFRKLLLYTMYIISTRYVHCNIKENCV